MLSVFAKLRKPLKPPAHLRLSYTNALQTLPTPPPLQTLETPIQTAEARTWLCSFRPRAIPRNLVELSFSRSSGPGGQNVNKVNTKATLRCPVDRPWIPQWANNHLTKSPYYVASTHSLLITSTAHRSQARNIEECLRKLHGCILNAASAPIRNQPSPEQRKRVQELERAEKVRRRTEKDKRNSVKSGRQDRKGSGAWD